MGREAGDEERYGGPITFREQAGEIILVICANGKRLGKSEEKN